MPTKKTYTYRAKAVPPPQKSASWKRYARYVALAVAGAIVFVGAYAEFRYGFFRSGPKADRSVIAAGSGIVAVVDPAKLADVVEAEVRTASGWPVPGWAVQRILPYEGGAAAALNFDQRRVDVKLYVNPNKLGPVARRLGDTLRFSDAFPRLRWKKGISEPGKGLVMKEGVVPFASDAEEAFFYTWNQSIELSALPLEGGHLLEVVFDNRQGLAFLAVASMLEAYEIDLGAKETDISLSSLQFVREARLTADVSESDTLRIRFVLEILPEEVEKLGVVNLKVGLDDVFKNYAERWQREHRLTLEGESSWEGTRIVYDYRLSSAREAFHLLVSGELR